MNLINTNLIETINTNMRDNDYTNLPKWAFDERIYMCDPPKTEKEQKSNSKVRKKVVRLFGHAIVNPR
jgi:hypothetical protein